MKEKIFHLFAGVFFGFAIYLFLSLVFSAIFAFNPALLQTVSLCFQLGALMIFLFLFIKKKKPLLTGSGFCVLFLMFYVYPYLFK